MAKTTLVFCHCYDCGEWTREPQRHGWVRDPDNGEWYCPRCISYTVDQDTGNVICAAGHVTPP
jgi:hypothetical protein